VDVATDVITPPVGLPLSLERGIRVKRISKVAGGKNLSKEGADKGPSNKVKLSG
jgi:hypothetical protein